MATFKNIIDHLNLRSQNPALVFGDRTYSYADLAQKVGQVTAHFSSQSKNAIGLVPTDSIEAYALFLGIIISGNTVVPLSQHSLARHLSEVVESVKLSEVLGDDSSAWRLRLEPRPTGWDAIFKVAETKAFEPFQYPDGASVAYILFTSGTTGTPKGVPIKFANVEAFLRGFDSLNLPLGPADRFLQTFDLSFDLAIGTILLALACGGSCYFLSVSLVKPLAIYQTINKRCITFVLMVPSVLDGLNSYVTAAPLKNLKYSFFCGEALKRSQLDFWRRLCPRAESFNVYGPTEATIFCSFYRANEGRSHDGIISIGEPLGKMRMEIIDQYGQVITQTGRTGELCLHGTQVMEGYLGLSSKPTNFLKIDGQSFYRTGDICFYAQGFYYVGRLDQQVKINGYRVELGAIEHTAQDLFSCTSLAFYDYLNDDTKSLILVLQRSGGINENSYKEKLRRALPPHMVPRRIFCVEALAYNLNGKTDRQVTLNTLRTQLYSQTNEG